MGASIPAKIVFASGNRGKLREVSRLLAAHDIEVLAQSALGVDEAAETGATFRENSLIKSRHAAAVTGLPALADDSGLAVDALGGDPGVRSARYAGPDASDADNVDKLLDALRGVPPERRTAAFRCVASFVDPALDPAEHPPLIGEGVWRGRVLEAAAASAMTRSSSIPSQARALPSSMPPKRTPPVTAGRRFAS